MEDDCQFWGVHMRLSTRLIHSWAVYKLFLSKITKSFPEKSHECALKLTELWNTRVSFDLNYKFINGSLAFNPG